MDALTDIVLDFETYYDTGFSLTNLTYMEYVLDPRFEVIGMSLKVGDKPAKWISGEYRYLRLILAGIDWSKVRVVAHNAMFDGAILEWHFGVRPAAYFCTMVASRPYVVPNTGSASLAAVADYLGCGKKGNEVQNHRGRRRLDFSKDQLDSYGAYCCDDTELASNVAAHLLKWLPDDEQYLINLTMMKFLRPKLRVDKEPLLAGLQALDDSRAEIVTKIGVMGVTPSAIRSRPRFIALLESRGVQVPTKTSKTTGKSTAAMAKDDMEFIGLLNHPNPEVATLVEAKLMLSSTIEETRLNRFIKIWEMDLGKERLFPIPLLYYAAHPGRFGGTQKINVQNMPRPDKKNPRKGLLRRSLVAPPGHEVIAADFSNIEARIVATLAEQWDLVEAFAKGEDIYSKFASMIYGRPINKNDHPIERFVGKTCILGLGYGMGYERFLLAMAMAKVKMDEAEAKRIVYLYREVYHKIPALWRTLEDRARDCLNPKAMFKWGPLLFMHERIVLPNNMPIIYPRMAFDTSSGVRKMTFMSRRKGAVPKLSHLWGGIFTENVTQALARIVATTAEIRIARAGLPCAHQAHDELIWVAPAGAVPSLIPAIEKTMCRRVEWLPRLSIAVEINHGKTYGDCK